MTELTIDRILGLAPVIPVVTVERAADAVPLARALLAGGLPVIEITLRTPAAPDAAAAIMAQVPDAVVGLGTLLDPEGFERARAIGVRFTVSPGLTPALAEAAARSGLPFLPGVATASELMVARRLGFRFCKFFPAEPMGGRAALRALAGPFPEMRFCPTGGITEDMVIDYLALPNVVCVGGSWIAPPDDIAAGAWDEIAERARRAAECRRVPG